MLGPLQPRPARRPVHLPLEAALVDEARELGIPLSATVEAALRVSVAAARERHWLEENRDAIEAYNARIDRDGMFGDDLRMFLLGGA